MAPVHFCQAVALLALSSDFTLPVTSSFVKIPENASGPGEGIPEIETIVDLPIGPLIASFLFVSAVDHLLLSLPGINRWYQRNLDNGVNWARWWEYAISSSIMIVVIGMFPGIYDLDPQSSPRSSQRHDDLLRPVDGVGE